MRKISRNLSERSWRARVCGLCLLLILAAGGAAAEPDLDGDGVPDSRDRDQDNDGILNVNEGLVTIVAGDLRVVDTFLYRRGSMTTSDAGRSARYLLDAENTQIQLHGSAVASASDVNWSEHNSLIKVQSIGSGVATILWTTRRGNVAVPVNMDITVSDLDVARKEAVVIDASMLVGYSVSDSSALDIRTTEDGIIKFSATDSSEQGSASVVLHVRDRTNLVIGYSSDSGGGSAIGTRAGFRHAFNAGTAAFYTPMVKAIDSDADGIPDHRDTDSDNDAVHDAIASGAVVDVSKLESITVDAGGVPLFVQPPTQPPVDTSQIHAPDVDVDADALVALSESKAQDTDGDGLSDEQEVLLGTNVLLVDTDGDGYPDAEEVMVFHTNPRDVLSAPRGINAPAIDSDGDGIADQIETIEDTDADSLPNQYDLDSDNDGIADALEAGLTDADFNGLVDNAAMTITERKDLVDTDGDSIPDFLDLDSDGDGVFDRSEAGFFADLDEDGVADAAVDKNNNGWEDRVETIEQSLPDRDNDGVPDYLDTEIQRDIGAALHSDETVEPDLQGTLITGVKGGGCVLDSIGRDGSMFVLMLVIVALRKIQLSMRQ